MPKQPEQAAESARIVEQSGQSELAGEPAGQYKHLSKTERSELQLYLEKGYSYRDIGQLMGRKHSTLSREKQRNQRVQSTPRHPEPGYDSDHAQLLAGNKRRGSKYQGMKLEGHQATREFVISALKDKQRPETIAGRLREQKARLPSDDLLYVSARAIYKWLYSAYGQPYCHLLPSKRYKTNHRQPTSPELVAPHITNRQPLSQRPLAAILGAAGHVEADTMVSSKRSRSKAAIAVSTDRLFKTIRATRLANLQPSGMSAAMRAQNASRPIAITSTGDNGLENRDHQDWGLPVFFCAPYSSWQKGQVEHQNKLLRAEGITKGSDLSLISEEQLQTIVDTINNRWRKSLNYLSPNEMELLYTRSSNKLTKNDGLVSVIRGALEG